MQVVATKLSPRVMPSADDGAWSFREVSRLFEVPEHRLRYWSQTGFLMPSLRRGERRLFSFRDLIAVKVAKGLLDSGLPLRRVRRQLEALRTSLPRVEAPLHDLRIRCEHDRVVVDDVAHRFEAASGQLVLDFEVSALRAQAAQVLALPWVEEEGPRTRSVRPEQAAKEGPRTRSVRPEQAAKEGPRTRSVRPEQAAKEHLEPPCTAHEWFLFAQQLEDEWDGAPADTEGSLGGPPYSTPDGVEGSLGGPPYSTPDGVEGSLGGPPYSTPDGVEGLAQVRHAYEAALELDPGLAGAWTNLGRILAQIGELEEAAEHFEQALRCDPEEDAARLNLAALALQARRTKDAVTGYRAVLRRDPDCLEAHYGLGRALLQQGGKGEALAHLERFRVGVERLPADERDPELEARREQVQAVIGTLRGELGRLPEPWRPR
jgi:DNA-binding transcriptional MerR regulator